MARCAGSWTLEADLRDVQVAGCEACLAVGQVELPPASEDLVEAVARDLAPLRVERVPPAPQRLRVVPPEGVHLGDPQTGVPPRGVLDRAPRGDQPAGEDVLLDPAVGVPGGEVAVVAHQDRLDGHGAAGCEPGVEHGEVRRPVLLADRLDHLDAHDRVVAAVGLAVVLQPDVDEVGEPGGVDPRLRERGLLGRQGQRGDVRPAPGRLDRQGAPAGADLQHPGARGRREPGRGSR